ncbi:TlpA family protein disulfide reductase [Corynebacterium sp. P3-F1]|uniref:TlpA family protein disulfide reductase n=1 Tax=Corynebacterium sp. P3-F1 TaxID=3059080 RepID=UPI003466B6F0
MRKQVWASVAVLVAVTVVVVAAAVWMLRSGESTQSEPEQSVNNTGDSADFEQTEAAVQRRPDCPGQTVGGVELPCLGGGDSGAQNNGADHKGADRVGADRITVANVWAWWCEPCRAELPALDEFAREHPEYTVVGVHADTNAANGAALLNDLGMELPSYQDSSNAFAGTLGLPGVVPVTVVFRGKRRWGFWGGAFRRQARLRELSRGCCRWRCGWKNWRACSLRRATRRW